MPSLRVLLFLAVFSLSLFGDPSRGKQNFGLGVEGLGRTISPGIFADYCLFPRFAVGLAQSLMPGQVQNTGETASILSAYANLYVKGEYWAWFLTFGAMLNYPGKGKVDRPLLPGFGIEYRAHWGLLFRASLYFITSLKGPNSLQTPIGTLWPGVSLGLALPPDHSG